MPQAVSSREVLDLGSPFRNDTDEQNSDESDEISSDDESNGSDTSSDDNNSRIDGDASSIDPLVPRFYVLNSTESKARPKHSGFNGTRKRRWNRSDANSSSDSNRGSDEDSEIESISLHNHSRRKRRKSNPQLQWKESIFRSPSPFPDHWSDADEVSPPDLVEESGNDSHLPSEIPDSGSDFEWGLFIREDSEMLPVSNFEAEFILHRAEMSGSFTYKGWIQDDDSNEPEDPSDAPWYPCDPDNGLVLESGGDLHMESSGNNPEDADVVCYGMIHKVRVKVLPQAPKLLNELRSDQSDSDVFKQQDIYLFKVHFDKDGTKFLLQSSKSSSDEINLAENIAVLNREITNTLSEVATLCTLEAYSSAKLWSSFLNGISADDKNNYVLVDINLYGAPKHCVSVGDILNDKKVYLQEPDYCRSGLRHMNPHFLDLDTVQSNVHSNILDPLSPTLLQMGISFQHEIPDEHAINQKLLKQKIAAAFKGMTRAQNLKRITADIRIRTPLLEYQEKALDFIMQRENGPITEEYCLWRSENKEDTLFKHIITETEKHGIPVETGGGILADDMGLGKTLTMLSAIIRTADDAKEFAGDASSRIHLSAEHTSIRSRATLVVVPSPILLNEWREEVKIHCTGFSNISIYHGHGREGNAKALADSDIVLSTYHTISHELLDKHSPLWKIRWFRIILDEAHIIRSMTTKLFRAMKKLHGNFRWCLTGTPVQNSLEDLAALISFIRSFPLDDFHAFRKHIIKPLLKGSENGVDNLRLLLDSLCLRRTKELLNLPEAFYDVRLLKFSAKEEQHYVQTRDKLIKMIHQNRMQSKSKNSYLGVFQLQLQLRRLCNHGSFQQLSLGAEEFDPEQAIAHLKKQKEAKCEVCGIDVTGIHGIEEKRSGSFTTCGHLLCMRCIPTMKLALVKMDGQEDKFRCSLCEEYVNAEYIVTDETSSKPSKCGNKHLSAWQYFDRDGCSTKVSAVVEDIEKHKTSGKSIVFSCWTRSLDLVGIFLKSRNIDFVRIDGSHSLVQRKWILENYQKDPTIKILLMTTGTGAIGLNLTVANCVYLLEPQWNPMVESQAIARVLRLGQKRNVRVVRYIMKDTIEQAEMHSQQVLKLGYARLGWNKGEENK